MWQHLAQCLKQLGSTIVMIPFTLWPSSKWTFNIKRAWAGGDSIPSEGLLYQESRRCPKWKAFDFLKAAPWEGLQQTILQDRCCVPVLHLRRCRLSNLPKDTHLVRGREMAIPFYLTPYLGLISLQLCSDPVLVLLFTHFSFFKKCFWLCWAFVAIHRLSLVVVCVGFSFCAWGSR